MTNATKKFLTLIFTFFVLAGTAYAQEVEPDTPRRAAWQAFQAENGASWTVRWNEKTGTPASLVSGVTKPYPGAPAEAARAFLREYHRLFGMEPGLPDLELAGVRRQHDVQHVRFQQTYEGLPVYEADYLVHLRDGRVIMANGTYYPRIQAPATPRLSEAAAQRVALGDLKGKPQVDEITSELMIYPEEGQFHLAWRLTVPTAPFGGWGYFIDAQSGAILAKGSLLMDVTGDGRVYPKHPDISSTAIRNLRRLNGTGRLRGTYVRVVNDEASEAYRANHSFRYSPSSTHFDEVNLYFHVDRFRKQFINDYVDAAHPLNFTQITAHAHSSFIDLNGNLRDDNAWFSPTDQELYFGDASSSPNINDLAKEDKVIYHEYTHAVIYDINTGISPQPLACEEEDSINEGTADYFAGAFTGRPLIGEYVNIETRNMANPEIGSYDEYESREGTYGGYPCFSSGVEPHDGGEFWSSVLWKVRNEPDIHGESPNELVFDALFYMDSNPTFREFRDAVVTETHTFDDDRCQVRSVFAQNGIGSACVGAQVAITGPLQLIKGQSYTWTATVTPSNRDYEYGWWYRFHDGDHEGPWYGMCGGSGLSCTHTFNVSGTTFVDIKMTARAPNIFDGSSFLGAWVTDPDDGDCNALVTGPTADHLRPPDCDAVEQVAASSMLALPEEFALEGNAPNPFNKRTEIHFALPEAAHVRLVVYDVMGREVMRLLDEELPPGYHMAPVDASDLASGIYIYRMTAGEKFTDTRRLVVVK